ncbi:DUF72 domain-containing protein [Paenibacillus turpanensis]|uniref:DUF72 domain-containing protein n=1 Tax=Paenibacillus turpanensis TaxID=2689078 RepID=UPI0014073D19|nr:DUF72 domain-containing protein [Paenibacillus turpanensis]
MIWIGLAGWGDHPELYTDREAAKHKLASYGAHFPVVEVDTSFYAIQPERNYAKWAEETPEGFRFVVKAYQGMTGHARGGTPYADDEEMFRAFRESIQPLQQAGKLEMVLFQYPPWFDCTKEHVEQLRRAKERMDGISSALEFRNQSWFTEELRERTLTFMRKEGWIHSVCDEPQAGAGSVPTVLAATDEKRTLVRFHGRNREGWNSSGEANWRDVRYLYNYSEVELIEWKERLGQLEQQSRDICVIFNNNSGGHAAGNAKQLQKLLGLEYDGLHPRQLEWF